jgi:hypothetical protein
MVVRRKTHYKSSVCDGVIYQVGEADSWRVKEAEIIRSVCDGVIYQVG